LVARAIKAKKIKYHAMIKWKIKGGSKIYKGLIKRGIL
jgi:hypothetical protein